MKFYCARLLTVRHGNGSIDRAFAVYEQDRLSLRHFAAFFVIPRNIVIGNMHQNIQIFVDVDFFAVRHLRRDRDDFFASFGERAWRSLV